MFKKKCTAAHIYIRMNYLLTSVLAVAPKNPGFKKKTYKSKTLGKCYLIPLQFLMLRQKTKIKLTC